MRLFTVQPREVVDKILTDGRFVCDISKSWIQDQNPEVYEAYKWLSERMTEKVGPAPKGVEFPVWAWYRHDTESVKYNSSSEVSKEDAIITLEIDDNRVVLSGFDKWEQSAYMGLPYVDYSGYDDDDAAYDEFKRIEKLGEKAVRASWDGVFDIDDIDEEEYVQATLWEIRKEDVVSIEYFKYQLDPNC